LPFLVVMAIVSGIWFIQYQHNRLSEKWGYMVPLICIGALYSFRRWREMELRSFAGHYEQIPFKGRFQFATQIAFWTFVVCLAIWVLQFFKGWLSHFWWYVWPVAVPGLGLSLMIILEQQGLVLSPAASQEKQRLEEEKRAEEARADDRQLWELEWWFRYPMAALGIWLAFQLYLPSKPVWLPIACLIFAAVCGWELALLGVGMALLYGAFKVIAALPVSVAVVVGALIIAGAVSRRQNG
jgi:hypothetical protein